MFSLPKKLKLNPLQLSVVCFLVLMLGMNMYRFHSYSPENNQPLDFRQLYAGTQLLDLGLNPYSDSLLKTQWKSNFEPKELEGLALPGGPENYLVYPPPVLAVLLPLASMTWFDARILVWSLCAASLFLIGILASEQKKWPQIALSLLVVFSFKGSITALILAQPLLLSLLFIVVHRHFERKNQAWLSAFFLLLAFLKPSCALPFLFFMLAEKRYKSLSVFIGFSLLTLAITFLSFGYGYTLSLFSGWTHNMQHQLAVAYVPGHEFLLSNLTSLSAMVYGLFQINSSFLDFPLLLLFSSLLLFLRWKKQINAPTTLFLLLTSSFLFSYHLYYDLLLFIPLLSFVQNKSLPSKAYLLLLLLYLPFGAFSTYLNMHAALLLGIGLWFCYEARQKKTSRVFPTFDA